MLRISPVQNKDEQAELCARFGAEYRPSALAYSAYDSDRDEIIGVCQFSVAGGTGELLDLVCPDGEALYLMGRAAVSFLNRVGIGECLMKNGVIGENEKMNALRLGFKNNGEAWRVDTSWSPCESHLK